MPSCTDLTTLVDQIGQRRALELLGVQPRTLKRWMTGKTPVPQMAWAALWQISYWGRSESLTAAENEVRVLRQLVEAVQRENAALVTQVKRTAALVDWECENDPLPARLMA